MEEGKNVKQKGNKKNEIIREGSNKQELRQNKYEEGREGRKTRHRKIEEGRERIRDNKQARKEGRRGERGGGR